MVKPSILIIDDDLGIREALKDLLELEGFDVAVAENGRKAIERIQQGVLPRVILLDLMMPQMNGWEFLAARRADSTISAIPVVAVSAFLDQVNDSEIAAVLRKPIDVDQLFKVLRQHCGYLA